MADIFHNARFDAFVQAGEGFVLYHYFNNCWEECVEDGEVGWRIVDEPDETAEIREHENSVFLRPNESWNHAFNAKVEQFTESDEAIQPKVRDRLRYWFKGATLDWWAWDGREGHSNTTVDVPCLIVGDVV